MSFSPAESLRCRSDFPALARMQGGIPLCYLDGPGGTQVPRPVIAAMADFYATCNCNTGGQFLASREAGARLWCAREVVAEFLGAPAAACISFGANMTTLAFALSRALSRTLRPGDEVVITQLDHEANRGPWLRLREHGAVIKEVALQADGRLDEEDLRRKIGPATKLVAIGYSSNLLGTVNPVELARELTRAVGAWLAVDAVHYAPHFPLDVAALDPDFLLCSAYKFYGPHVGILYTRQGLLERLPTDVLGTQEPSAPYLIETGTLNFAAIEGVRAAVEYLASWGSGATLRAQLLDALQGISQHEHALARRYFEQVREIPGVTVWGPDFSSRRRAPTVSITLDGHSPTAVAARLAEDGFCVWDGNFYAARAVEVLGLADRGGVLRTGISMYTSQAEIDRLLSSVARIADTSVNRV